MNLISLSETDQLLDTQGLIVRETTDLLGREGRVENKSYDVKRAIDDFISVRETVDSPIFQLHEHVVIGLQGMCVCVRFRTPALYKNDSS